MSKTLLTTTALAAAIALAWGNLPSAHSADDTEATMQDLNSVDQLKTRFNADAGKRRLLLLLSPT